MTRREIRSVLLMDVTASMMMVTGESWTASTRIGLGHTSMPMNSSQVELLELSKLKSWMEATGAERTTRVFMMSTSRRLRCKGLGEIELVAVNHGRRVL